MDSRLGKTMNRLINFLKGLFNSFFDKVEDPMVMLDQAKRDMQALVVKNREMAVQAITQRNQLVAMLAQATQKATNLEQQAGTALKMGNRDMAMQFLVEKKSAEANVANLTTAKANADAAVENVKAAIAHQEADFRKKCADALVMKANYKSAQAQNAISKALDGMNFEDTNSTWGTAADKISSMQSEAAARQEMQSTSLQSKVWALEDASHNQEAESDLAALEARLGLTSPVQAGTTTQLTAATGGAEAELNALEQRLAAK